MASRQYFRNGANVVVSTARTGQRPSVRQYTPGMRGFSAVSRTLARVGHAGITSGSGGDK